jgi:tryptophan-rich sensory protein
MSPRFSLFCFLTLVLGCGLTIGYITAPGEWYAQLTKPTFNPPSWLFAPVWTAIYILIAFAGWRTWHRDRAGWSMMFWWAQLFLNLLWPPAFFLARRIDLALAVILLLLLIIAGFIATSWRQDRMTAWLFAPYAAWVAFATLLNVSIYFLN